jgi:CDP-4-dehydro-6-deoxyglucose reductase, E1
MNYIYPAKQVTDQAEIDQILEVAESGHFAAGKKADEFSKKLKKFLGVKNVLLCNSGSSANLLAMSAVKELFGLKSGYEVITTACGFPTTVNPIIQTGLVPVFIDIELGTYVPTVDAVEEAISSKTKAVFMAHTLGNPFPVREIKDLCDKHGLILLEDCCDALGSTYKSRMVGTFGEVATLSMFPAHIISTGEGGAVFTKNSKLASIIESYCSWGKDCWCPPGVDNTCGKRFSWELGSLPFGYDHKYIFSRVGYNLKMSDLHAAVGVAQMDKLEGFIEKRNENYWNLLISFLDGGLGKYFIIPEILNNSHPVPFGFCLTIRDGVSFTKLEIVKFLEEKGIGSRSLFGGNLIRQPAYQNVKHRISGTLKNSDKIMTDTFWIGCHPAIDHQDIKYMIDTFIEFVNRV